MTPQEFRNAASHLINNNEITFVNNRSLIIGDTLAECFVYDVQTTPSGERDIEDNVTPTQAVLDQALIDFNLELDDGVIDTARREGYGEIGDQLDKLWHDIDNGIFGEGAKLSTWYTDNKTVKDDNPKVR